MNRYAAAILGAIWMTSAGTAYAQTAEDIEIPEYGAKRPAQDADEILVFPDRGAGAAPPAEVPGGATLEGAARLARAKDYPAALALLESLANAPGGADPASGYLHAWVLQQLGRTGEALVKYEAVSADPLVGDRALFDRIGLLVPNDPLKASALADALAAGFPDSPAVEEALLIKAELLIKDGLYLKALALIRETMVRGVKAPEKWLWPMAQCQESSGDHLGAYAAYSRLYFQYPHTSFSAKAFAEMGRMKKGRKVFYPQPSVKDKLQRVEILMTNRMYRDASEYIRSIDKSAFTAAHRAELYMFLGRAWERLGNRPAALAVYAEAAAYRDRKIRPEALYRMARIQWNRDNNAEAVALLGKISKEFPTHEVMASVLNMLGRMDESNGDRKAAIKKLDRASANFPSAPISENSLWLTGWLRYLDGDYAGAEAVMARVARQYENTPSAPMALYWRARALESAGGDPSEPLKTLGAKYPLSYYALLVGGNGLFFRLPADFAGADANMEKTALRKIADGVAKYGATPELSGRHRWAYDASQVWLKAGFAERARELLHIAMKGAGNSREAQTWAAAQYYRAGCFQCVLRLADGILHTGLDADQRDFLSLLVFPLGYWRTVDAEARANGLDPFIVLSVIRQESVFDPDIVSIASAHGLMQIIPSTAERVGKEKGVGPVSAEALHVPERNIELGAFYLASLIRGQKGELPLALAEYNAGPRPVAKWKEKYPYDDVLRFIERIPYSETREYVKKVLRNYGVYRKVYLDNMAGNGAAKLN